MNVDEGHISVLDNNMFLKIDTMKENWLLNMPHCFKWQRVALKWNWILLVYTQLKSGHSFFFNPVLSYSWAIIWRAKNFAFVGQHTSSLFRTGIQLKDWFKGSKSCEIEVILAFWNRRMWLGIIVSPEWRT